MIEKQAIGIFNATGQPMTFETFLAECEEVSKTAVTVQWVSENFLLGHKVEDWIELPLWISKERNMPGFLSINSEKAMKAGLKFRPLIRDNNCNFALGWPKKKSFSKSWNGSAKRRRAFNVMELRALMFKKN